MKIEITQEDIDCGLRRSTSKCPIAKALARQTDGVWIVETCYVEDCSTRKMYGISRAMRSFIYNFDLGRPVRPAKFVIGKVLGKWE